MADPHLVSDIESVALWLARRDGSVTADDVRQLMPNAPYKRSAFGAAFLALVKTGKLVPCGYEASRHPSNHGRRIAIYKLGRVC